ncbi:MAG: hypothetical protein V7K31_10470 [Nostoc sp.]
MMPNTQYLIFLYQRLRFYRATCAEVSRGKPDGQYKSVQLPHAPCPISQF